MKLTNFEFRACQILLTAARAGAGYDEMRRVLRREDIPEGIWRALYSKLGLGILVCGEGDGAKRYVLAPDNILPFAPRGAKRVEWPWPIPNAGGGAA